MALKDDLVGAVKRTAGRASKRMFVGLNRADELGGEFRDYLLAREDKLVFRKLGERLARFGGISVEGDGVPSKYEQDRASETAAAPPPSAVEIAEAALRKGLGDADVAAQVYGRDSCPWTGRAITLLNDAKVDFDFIDLDDADNRHHEGKLTAETQQSTVPWVYLRGGFVGGYNELNEVVRLGELDYRTLAAEDKKAADAVRKRVEIAPRKQAG